MHLSRIALYSFASLDLVVSSSYPLFLFTRTISSYYPTRLLSRSVCIYQRFMSPSTPLLLYFSNLPEIVFLLVRDRLCHRPSFPPGSLPLAAHGLLAVSSFGMLVHFNFLGTLLLSIFTRFTRITFYLQVYTPSPFLSPSLPPPSLSLCLLSRFLKFLLFNLHFSEWLSFSIVRSHRDALHFAHLFQFSLDLLILSINQISLPPFFLSELGVDVSVFSLIARCFTWRQQHQGFTFTLLSSTSLASLCLTNPFSSFSLSLSSTTLPVCPQQICTLF